MDARVEKRIILLLAAVQFVNILDFMIVMPLGPDFAADLGIPLSHLPTIAGAYAASAGISGLIGAFVLDRFDRRKALAVALVGLAVGTAGGALATGTHTLVLARVVAGLFGGPATSLAMAILTDVIPNERRGRAMGSVMIAFSIASVLGVPAALELAHRGTWHTPFILTGVLALLGGVGAWVVLPPIRGHLERPREPALEGFKHLLSRPLTQLAYLVTSISFCATFMVVPNIAAFVQGNLHYPREDLGLLYGVGGIVSLVTLRSMGKLVDRFGSFPIGAIGTALAALATWIGFVRAEPSDPLMLLFMLFMLANGMRNIAASTLSTKVPRAEERARYMSLQNVIQHIGSFTGTVVAGQVLGETADGALTGMSTVAWISIGMMTVLPPLIFLLESRVKSAARAEVAAAAVAG